jgi:hypothetical protein
MLHPIFENLVKKTKKEVGGRLKLSTGLPANLTSNLTVHDIFTMLLLITAIIFFLVL